MAPLIGIATGLVTAATGVFVIPAVPYLQALRLAKDDLVQSLGLSFTVSTVAMAASLAHEGAFGGTDATLSVLAVAPALVGMGLGQWLRGRISPEITRISVVLPAPFGPITPTASPSRTSSEAPNSAWKVP